MKKTFEIELQRVSYVCVRVEAHDEDEAETELWDNLEKYVGDTHDPRNAAWAVESIAEVHDGRDEE